MNAPVRSGERCGPHDDSNNNNILYKAVCLIFLPLNLARCILPVSSSSSYWDEVGQDKITSHLYNRVAGRRSSTSSATPWKDRPPCRTVSGPFWLGLDCYTLRHLKPSGMLRTRIGRPSTTSAAYFALVVHMRSTIMQFRRSRALSVARSLCLYESPRKPKK